MDVIPTQVQEALEKNRIVHEGLGVCPIHGCNLWGTSGEVWSYDYDSKDSSRVIGRHRYQVKVCNQCINESRDPDGLPIIQHEFKDYLELFKVKYHIDLKEDIIVSYSYMNELSVINLEKMKDWITSKVKNQIKVKILDVNKYLEQRRNRFMNAEQKEKFLSLTYEIEEADLLIVDSLGDYQDKDDEDFYTALLSTKDNAAIMILAIPESESRLEKFPSKLKWRFKNAQQMNLSSTANGLKK